MFAQGEREPAGSSMVHGKGNTVSWSPVVAHSLHSSPGSPGVPAAAFPSVCTHHPLVHQPPPFTRIPAVLHLQTAAASLTSGTVEVPLLIHPEFPLPLPLHCCSSSLTSRWKCRSSSTPNSLSLSLCTAAAPHSRAGGSAAPHPPPPFPCTTRTAAVPHLQASAASAHSTRPRPAGGVTRCSRSQTPAGVE